MLQSRDVVRVREFHRTFRLRVETQYEYDMEGNLSKVVLPAISGTVKKVYFDYNSSGEQYQRVVTSTAGSNQPTTDSTTNYLYVDGSLVAENTGSSVTWYNPGISQGTSTATLKYFQHDRN